MSSLLHRSLFRDCCLLLWWVALSVFLVLLPLHEGVVGQGGAEKGKRPIYIGALLPTSVGNKWRPNERLTPAIHHAVQDVNRNTAVLSNYTLHIIFEETECNTKLGLDKYLDLVEILPRKLMLLSGLCTELTAEIERASQLSMTKVPQISYGNSDSVFDDNYEHPNLFRIVPSESQFNAARLKLLVELGWVKGLGTLYQNTPTYSIPHNRQLVSLYRHEIPVLETQQIKTNTTRLTDELRQLKAKGVQVVLGNFNETWARRVFCQAYKVDMYGEKFSWILAGNYEAQWWKVEDTDCFPHELERALQGMIRIDILPLTTEIHGTKAPAFRNTYKLQTSSKLHGYVYDGIWATALALNNISYYYAEVENSGRSLDDYRASEMLSNSSFIYGNPLWLTALRKALSATSFVGVTGHVSFENQARKGHSLLIKQFQASMSGYDEVSVGDFDSVSGSLDLKKYSFRILRSYDDFQRFEREQELLDPTHFQSTVEDQQTRPGAGRGGGSYLNPDKSSGGSNLTGTLGTLFLLAGLVMEILHYYY